MSATRTMTYVIAATLSLAGAQAVQAQAPSQADAVQSLRELVAQPTSVDQDRSVIRDFLNRDDVRDVAAAHGIDVDRVETRAATLDAGAASDLAERIRGFEDQQAMVGGDAIVISTTALIIALLVLILLLVA